MKSQIMSEIQNVFNLFIHNYTAGCDVAGLFTQSGTLELVDKRLVCTGREEIAAGISARLCSFKMISSREYHMPHSPAFMVFDSMHRAKLFTETHTFLVSEDGAYQLSCSRFDVEFLRENDEWLISNLRWSSLQHFQPRNDSSAGLLSECPPCIRGTCVSACDYIEIQNLMGGYAQFNRRDAAKLFAHSDDVWFDNDFLIPGRFRGHDEIAVAFETIKEREQANLNFYLAVPYLCAPVICSDGESATGVWLAHTYTVRSSAFKRGGSEDIMRRIERYEARFIRENGVWRFLWLQVRTLAELATEPFDRAISGQADFSAGANWHYPDESNNHAHEYPFDAYLLQNILPEWTLRLRRGEMQEVPVLFFSEKTDKVVYDINVRRRIGVEAINECLSEFDRNCRFKQTTGHNGSSPYIYIDADNKSASVHWLDQSWTNMNAVFGLTDNPVKFMMNSGMYNFQFVKEYGEWKIKGIRWRVVFRLEDLAMDTDNSIGFCGSSSEVPWPLPFERVEYTPAGIGDG